LRHHCFTVKVMDIRPHNAVRSLFYAWSDFD
jgi:hypothetical protein